MKKIMLLFVAFAFALGFVGCTEETTTTTAATTTEAETTTQTTTTEVVDAKLAAMYEGSHTVSAMGSEVVYLYEITFDEGDYYFLSSFEMGGESYTFEETGTYTVTGQVIALTPEGETEVTGEVLEGGNISIPIKASSMATRGDQELTEVLVSRIYVGSHSVSAMGSEVVYNYQMTLMHGSYTFASEFEMGGEMYQYHEFGTYAVDGTTLTLTPDGEAAVTGSIADGSITVGIKASAMASRGDQTLDASLLGIFYEGSHVVSAMGSEVEYVYTVAFKDGAYSFHSVFTMGGTEYTYDEIGTYSVDSDGVVTLTPDGESAVTGQVNWNRTLTLPIKASSMATRGEQVLTLVIPVPEA